jgi:predicted outer membrane repeat protein
LNLFGVCFCCQARLVVEGTDFEANIASEQGGGLFTNMALQSSQTASLTACNFQSNTARAGGALYGGDLRAELTLNSVTFELNRARDGSGGAIRLTGSSSSLTCFSCNMRENFASVSHLNRTAALNIVTQCLLFLHPRSRSEGEGGPGFG